MNTIKKKSIKFEIQHLSMNDACMNIPENLKQQIYISTWCDLTKYLQTQETTFQKFKYYIY